MVSRTAKRVRRTPEAAKLAILEAAERRLIEGGPESVKVQHIAADLGLSDNVDHVANLESKSLIAADPRGEIARYRLLDTTGLYTFEELKSSGELRRAARRHAEYYQTLFAHADTESESWSQAQWLAIYGQHLDNVRAALDWAFSAEGDQQIGVALTVAAVPLWVQLSLLGECRERVERALARLNLISSRDPRHEIRLHAALGISLNYTTGAVSETAAAWSNTLIIARRLGDAEYLLRALRGLWAHYMNAGDYRRSLAFAHDFCSLAATSADPASLDLGNRMAALMLHYLGDQETARANLKHCLARDFAPLGHSQTARFFLDRDVTVQALLSRIYWLQGFSDQSTCAAQLAVDRALAIGHALSLCHALGQAMCPVALYTGDLVRAEDSVTTLLENAAERGLAGWIARGRCFLGMVMIARSDFAAGLPLLRNALAELRDSGAAPSYPAFLAILAEGLGRAGQVVDGLATIDQALMLSTQTEEHWCLPELLRTKGELVILDATPDAAAAAERHFLEALDWAGRQQALSWKLRTATSLAHLWRDQHRIAEARKILEPVYSRFSEGFETADLQRAKACWRN